MIITDGESNVNNFETIPEALRLKRQGVSIITVAIGFDSVNAELVGITSEPIADNLFRIDDFNSLDELHVKIVEPICTGIIVDRTAH